MKKILISDLKMNKPHYPYRVVGYLPPDLYRAMCWLLTHRHETFTHQIRQALSAYVASRVPSYIWSDDASNEGQDGG